MGAPAAEGNPNDLDVRREMKREAASNLGLLLCIASIAAGLSGCSRQENEAFLKSHASIRAGITLREVFASGLADYLTTMGIKNVVGATIPEKQPADSRCARRVLDISYAGVFHVRIYCGVNSPTAPQLLPGKKFESKEALLRALDAEYVSWANNMEFRVESPPRKIGGVYDHYRFAIDQQGQVASVSAIFTSQ